MKLLSQLLIVSIFTAFGGIALLAQTNPIEAAQPFIAARQFSEAVTVYEKWLITYPNDANIWRELGVVQSWNGQQLKSIEAFKKALELDPGNLQTHRSLGYAYAWRGYYDLAKKNFEFVLKEMPNDEESQKGMAYIALWCGDGNKAARQFSELVLRSPENVEYRLALAQAYKISGKAGKASQAYRAAKRLSPESRTLNQELAALRTQSVFAEIDIWGGHSEVANVNSDGLRLMQVALQLRQDLRVYARFDNSLSGDNLNLLLRGVRGNVYNLGGFYNWNDKTGTTVEAGMREFGEAQPTQYTLRAEQVYAVGKNFHLKGSVMAAFAKSTQSEWVIVGGTQVSVARWLALEPGLFFTRLNAFSYDHRLVLNTKFLPGKGYELNIGVLAGRAQVETETTMRKLTGVYFSGLFPISKPIWLMASYRHENGFFDKLDAAALGVRFRFGQPR